MESIQTEEKAIKTWETENPAPGGGGEGERVLFSPRRACDGVGGTAPEHLSGNGEDWQRPRWLEAGSQLEAE